MSPPGSGSPARDAFDPLAQPSPPNLNESETIVESIRDGDAGTKPFDVPDDPPCDPSQTRIEVPTAAPIESVGTMAEISGAGGGIDSAWAETKAAPQTPLANVSDRDAAGTLIESAHSRATHGASGVADTKAAPVREGNISDKKGPPFGKPPAEERYRLIENFAHGGLGSIWKAEDLSIQREVAFKELLPKALRNKVAVERFLEEAQITGQLEHPGIVPIYDLGYQENGTPYYSMKLLRGGNMERAIEEMHKLPRDSSERHLAFTRLLRQFVSVCQAVGFAHEKGVLHRDLKPLNVMIGEFGETLVLDWGLAKLVDVLGVPSPSDERAAGTPEAAPSDASQEAVATLIDAVSRDVNAGGTGVTSQRTQGTTRDALPHASHTQAVTSASIGSAAGRTQSSATESGTWFQKQVTTRARTAGSQTIMGQVMGTPAYMAPEQAEGLVDQLDARTDIYSLGGILYKLLTNEPPVSRGKIGDVLAAVIQGKIKTPREIDPTISKPLEAICRKAMAKKQADRYPKALDLAADVEACLADEPVSVYQEPWRLRFRRWRKRHRTLVTSTAATFIVLIAGAGLWSWIEATRIDGLRSAAQSKVVDARTAIEQSDFAKANTLLTEALGQVQAEAQLVAVRGDIQNQLDDVKRLQAAAERERVAEVRSKIEQRIAEAQQAVNDKQEFQQARVLLTEVVTLLSSETELVGLRQQAQTQLDLVNRAIAERADIDAAQSQLAKFEHEVEQTRIFGGRISGENAIEDSREAQKHGLAALELFAIDFDKPDQLDERLRMLGDDAIKSWRSGALEVLFTLVQLEISLVPQEDSGQLKAAARRGLERLALAEKLGLTSQPLWFIRSDLHGLLGESNSQTKALEQAESLKPESRLDHFQLGEQDRIQQKYAAALMHYQDALRVDPDDFWSLDLIGQCHLYAGQPAAAAASYTACIARRPDFTWPYLARAVAFAELKQFDNAHRDFAKVLELDPQSYYAHLNRGAVLVLQKDFAAARAEFEKAAALRPDLAAPHINLSEAARWNAIQIVESDAADAVLRAAAEFQKALTELTTAARISPQQASIYHFRGLVQVNLNAPQQALIDFERAIKLEPQARRHAASYKEIGRIHQRAGRMPEAVAAFDEALATNNADPETIRQRAEALLALGRHQEAVDGFTLFLEKSGPVGDVYRARGQALALLKKYREAINDYTMSLQYEPSPNMLTKRGWAYLNEAAKLAKQDFEEALRLNPDNPDTYQGLGYAKVTLGDYEGAVGDAEKSIASARKAAARYGPQGWPLFFNPATIYAQAVGKVLVDPKLSTERHEERAKQYTSRAVELLTEAARIAGPAMKPAVLEAIQTDTALDPIRQRPEFLEVMKSLDPESAKKEKS